MREKLNKKIFFILCLLIIIFPHNVFAVGLQANKGGTSLVNVDRDSMWYSIRQMEDSHGTLGIENDTDNKKNGIDCHMAKNTEWGTITMLSASRYGEVHQEDDETADTNTTTGNKSGIYQMGSGKAEFCATAKTNDYNGKYSESKYWNRYIVISGNKIPFIDGDATVCWNWYGSTYGNMTFDPIWVQVRGINKLFNFDRYGSETGTADISSRAIVVCASDI